MNILIVHSCKGFYGGAEEVVEQLCQHLIKRHSVFLVTKDAPMELFDNGARHIRTRGYADFRREVQNIARDWADVINTHNFPANLAVYPLKPVVWYCNEPPELFTGWMRKPIEAVNRWWVRKSGMKVVVADTFSQMRFMGLYGVKPEIVPYGIDYEFWSQPIEGKDRPFTMLQVGHPELFDKGKVILERVKREIPSAVLVQLFGESPEEVRRWYHNADVLIHPIGSQGGWLVPLEAICAGLPVVVSREFTCADLIASNHLGVVTDDIAGAVLVHGWTDGNLAKAKEWVRKNLTWGRFGRSMERIFLEVTR